MRFIGVILLAAVAIFLLIVGGIWLAETGSQQGWLPGSGNQAQMLVIGSMFILVFGVILAVGIMLQWPGPRALPLLALAVASGVGLVAVLIDIAFFRGEPRGRAGAIVFVPYALVLGIGFRIVQRIQEI